MKALRVLAAVAIAFGAASVASGGAVLFGGQAAAAGNAIPFVVWYNFLGGFAYVAVGAGLWRRASWAPVVAAALALLTALVFAALGGYIAAGAAFEMRTVAAMTLRTALWVAIAGLACWSMVKREVQS
jgi:hypothetical protein